MATLYVENVPDDLYKALRQRARERHRSIAAEVLALLGESVPTASELRARRELLRKLEQVRSKRAAARRSFPSTEEMQRQDRAR
ncbi:MAG TPA: Arc family DNA-binding protein [Terriglobales bacterium]|jgi:plasmid stability protein|nr:Arc family DNA-binding protein [Terriglobales bacterium]